MGWNGDEVKKVLVEKFHVEGGSSKIPAAQYEEIFNYFKQDRNIGQDEKDDWLPSQLFEDAPDAK